MTFKSLLPPNSTEFELILEKSLSIDATMHPLADTLLQLRSRRPDPLADFFAGEWGIAPFRPWFSDHDTFFATALPWLRCRGTEHAVTSALSWLNIMASIEVERNYMHIAFETPFTGANYDNVKLAIGESIPAHLGRYRIYSGYDLRQGQYDSSLYDDCIYDDDSGVWVDGVFVSYGLSESAKLDIKMQIKTGIQSVRTGQLPDPLIKTWVEISWADSGVISASHAAIGGISSLNIQTATNWSNHYIQINISEESRV